MLFRSYVDFFRTDDVATKAAKNWSEIYSLYKDYHVQENCLDYDDLMKQLLPGETQDASPIWVDNKIIINNLSN